MDPSEYKHVAQGACLWFLAHDKSGGRFLDRRGQVLVLDARNLGYLVDRTEREIAPEDIAHLADTYHVWRGESEAIKRRCAYADIPGFCKSAELKDIREHGHVLTPGRYVSAAEVASDGEPSEKKMARLTAQMEEQFAQSDALEATIRQNLRRLDYGG